MSLTQQAKRALAGLNVFADGQREVDVSHDNHRLAAELVALDTLACAFTRMSVRTEPPLALGSQPMRAVAEKLSARLTYLLEPINPIEIDAEGCVVQLRSNPPQKEEDRTSYYELLLTRGGELSLARHSRAAKSPRATIPAHVTREVFLRLVQDFSAALGEAG